MTGRLFGREPLLRHTVPADQWMEALDLAQALVLAGSGASIVVDGVQHPVPGHVLDAWMDMTTLLVARGRATVVVVDEQQECNVTQAMAMLRLDRASVKELVERNELTSRKVGSDTLIEVASLVAHATGTMPPTGDAPRLVDETRPPKCKDAMETPA